MEGGKEARLYVRVGLTGFLGFFLGTGFFFAATFLVGFAFAFVAVFAAGFLVAGFLAAGFPLVPLAEAVDFFFADAAAVLLAAVGNARYGEPVRNVRRVCDWIGRVDGSKALARTREKDVVGRRASR
jgi:hypothetical protein